MPNPKPNSRSSEPVDWLRLFAECDEHSSGIAPPPALPLRTIAVLNPPFGKQDIQHEIAQTYELGHGWRKPKSDSDSEPDPKWLRTGRVKKSTKLEALFLELAIRSVEPSEVVVALVPNGILANADDDPERCWIGKQAQVRASIQLPPTAWQAECKTGFTTSILVLQRLLKPHNKENDYTIFMAMIENCGFDSRGKTIPGSDLEEVAGEFANFIDQHGWCQEGWDSQEP